MIRIVQHEFKRRCVSCETEGKADVSVQVSLDGLSEPGLQLCASCLNKLGAKINSFFEEISTRAKETPVVEMNAFGEKPASEGTQEVREWTLKGIVNGIIRTFETEGKVEFNTREKGGGFSAEEIVKELSSRGHHNFVTGRDMNRTICKYRQGE